MAADHNAVDSTLGYDFQTLHALLVLLKANDEEAVTLELTDDVTLHHTPTVQSTHAETRFQVAHSVLPVLPDVTLKSTKLWKTLRIWASEYDPKERYFLLTCAPVSSDLQCLTSPGDRTLLLAQLEKEGLLVIQENSQKIHEHKERIQGCKAFLSLPHDARMDLLNRITLCSNGPNILAVDAMLDEAIRNIARPDKRRLMVQRLREYWMNRACLSLTGELPRLIKKSELQLRIEEISTTIAGNGLPDDYGVIQPPANTQAPDMMCRQIELVDGGTHRINRAKSAHWKSRNQRQRWLDDDVSIASRLNEFDQKLINMWNDRHGPMCDDTASACEEDKQRHGCTLLDWSHNEAPQWPVSVGRGPVPAYVTQGTYQDLATRLTVGWHPDFLSRLLPPGEKK